MRQRVLRHLQGALLSALAAVDHVAAVDEVEILTAIAVDIEDGHTGAEGLGQAFLWRGTVGVDEVDSGLCCDVEEPLRGRLGVNTRGHDRRHHGAEKHTS